MPMRSTAPHPTLANVKWSNEEGQGRLGGRHECPGLLTTGREICFALPALDRRGAGESSRGEISRYGGSGHRRTIAVRASASIVAPPPIALWPRLQAGKCK